MSALSIEVPFPVFQDRDGQPLENGYVWLGVANLNPQVNPVIAYFDVALTIPAAQPLRTINGYISNAGTPAQVYVDAVNFSILVQDSKGSMVYNFSDGTGISPDACGVTYTPPFTGGVAYPVCEKLEQTVSVKDFGAVGDGVANDTAAFTAAGSAAAKIQVLIPAGVYKLTTSPAPTGDVTWVVEKGASFTGAGVISTVSNKLVNYGDFKSIENSTSFYNGIFKYLENNAALTAYGTIGLHGSVESAGGAGTAGTADIAIAAFATNNLPSNLGGVWGLYSTVLREATAGAASHGMEIDIANMGATVQLFPSVPFASGLTSGIWCCTGGESTEPTAGGSPGVASVGLAIIQNDSQAVKTAKFDKGILFHNLAIDGTDGATGTGQAIAFATGHSMTWFNNLTQTCAEITVSGRTFALTNTRLDFSDFGLLYQSRVSGKNLFAITNSSTSVNGLTVVPANTGVSPRFAATGDDANIDLSLETKGVAYVNFQGAATPATAGAAAGYLAIKVNGTRYNIALNLP